MRNPLEPETGFELLSKKSSFSKPDKNNCNEKPDYPAFRLFYLRNFLLLPEKRPLQTQLKMESKINK